jgi:Flp pilus assembly pilin Flp
MEKKSIGLFGLLTALGSLALYTQKEKIGAGVDEVLRNTISSFSNYLAQASYASKKLGVDISSALNYYSQQMSALNQQLGSNIAINLALLLGSISVALLVTYLSSREK